MELVMTQAVRDGARNLLDVQDPNHVVRRHLGGHRNVYSGYNPLEQVVVQSLGQSVPACRSLYDVERHVVDGASPSTSSRFHDPGGQDLDDLLGSALHEVGDEIGNIRIADLGIAIITLHKGDVSEPEDSGYDSEDRGLLCLGQSDDIHGGLRVRTHSLVLATTLGRGKITAHNSLGEILHVINAGYTQRVALARITVSFGTLQPESLCNSETMRISYTARK